MVVERKSQHVCSVQSAEPPFSPVRQSRASAPYLVLRVQMRGRWCAFTTNTKPSIDNKTLCFKEFPSYGDKGGMKAQLFTLCFLHPLAVSQAYLTILLIIVQSWPLKVRGFLHCCSPFLSKIFFAQEPSEQHVLDWRCESPRQTRCITLCPCLEHCGWAPVVENSLCTKGSQWVWKKRERSSLGSSCGHCYTWRCQICGIWGRGFSFCLCFSPSKNILIGNKLNNFPQIESVSPVMVTVKWSPCLHLDWRTLLSSFHPLQCWGEWECLGGHLAAGQGQPTTETKRLINKKSSLATNLVTKDILAIMSTVTTLHRYLCWSKHKGLIGQEVEVIVDLDNKIAEPHLQLHPWLSVFLRDGLYGSTMA